jgi:hypothetical protein
MNCVAILKGQSVSFLEASSSAGISFKHTDGNDSQPYLPALMPAGVAMFDYDGDGLIDIYFPSGAPLPGCEPAENPLQRLFPPLARRTCHLISRSSTLSSRVPSGTSGPRTPQRMPYMPWQVAGDDTLVLLQT